MEELALREDASFTAAGFPYLTGVTLLKGAFWCQYEDNFN